MRNTLLSLFVVALAALFVQPANASCTDNITDTSVTASVMQFLGSFVHFEGACTEDNEELIVTGDMSQFDACLVMSTTGSVDVFVSLDGTNFSTAPLSLQDFGATDTNPALLTVALRTYGFVGKYRKIKVLENGATDAAASLNCWKL